MNSNENTYFNEFYRKYLFQYEIMRWMYFKYITFSVFGTRKIYGTDLITASFSRNM